jgi:hypothetical protein
LVIAIILTIIVLVLMASMQFLHRWPIAVGPAAILGALVIIRFWVEAVGASPAEAAAWSSSVALLISGFYVGGSASRFGLSSARQLLAPALAIGWTWRYWVFLAALLGAVAPFYKTHFFDASSGRIAARLASFAVGGFLLEGLVAGLLVWAIAVWMARATRATDQS